MSSKKLSLTKYINKYSKGALQIFCDERKLSKTGSSKVLMKRLLTDGKMSMFEIIERSFDPSELKKIIKKSGLKIEGKISDLGLVKLLSKNVVFEELKSLKIKKTKILLSDLVKVVKEKEILDLSEKLKVESKDLKNIVKKILKKKNGLIFILGRTHFDKLKKLSKKYKVPDVSKVPNIELPYFLFPRIRVIFKKKKSPDDYFPMRKLRMPKKKKTSRSKSAGVKKSRSKEVKKLMDSIEKLKVKSLVSKQQSLEKEIKEIKLLIDKNIKTINNVIKGCNTIDNQLEMFEKKFKDEDVKIRDSIDKKIEELKKKLSSFNDKTEKRISSLKKQFDKRMDSLEKKSDQNRKITKEILEKLSIIMR